MSYLKLLNKIEKLRVDIDEGKVPEKEIIDSAMLLLEDALREIDHLEEVAAGEDW